MDDAIESGQVQETRSSSAAFETHRNWLREKLEEITIKSEMNIKGETMAVDMRTWLKDISDSFLTAAITGHVAHATDTNTAPEVSADYLIGGITYITSRFGSLLDR